MVLHKVLIGICRVLWGLIGSSMVLFGFCRIYRVYGDIGFMRFKGFRGILEKGVP